MPAPGAHLHLEAVERSLSAASVYLTPTDLIPVCAAFLLGALTEALSVRLLTAAVAALLLVSGLVVTGLISTPPWWLYALLGGLVVLGAVHLLLTLVAGDQAGGTLLLSFLVLVLWQMPAALLRMPFSLVGTILKKSQRRTR